MAGGCDSGGISPAGIPVEAEWVLYWVEADRSGAPGRPLEGAGPRPGSGGSHDPCGGTPP